MRNTSSHRARHRTGFLFWFGAGVQFLVGCGGGENPAGPGARVLHVLSDSARDTDFFALPFPSDLRLKTRPSVAGPATEQQRNSGFDLSKWPRPGGQPGKYLAFLDGKVPGAGPGAAVYFRLDAPIDERSLPSVSQSAEPSATAFLVDITVGSKTYGQRVPSIATFHAEGNRHILDNWLSIRPVPGLPLRENTQYAAVLLSDIQAQAGGGLSADPDFRALLSGEQPATEPHKGAWVLYAPLRNFLAQQGLTERVAGATVFTTQNATGLVPLLRKKVLEQAQPTLEDLIHQRSHDGLTDIYTGSASFPNFQQGSPPYWSEGGGIELGPSGEPQVARTEKLRIAMSIPRAQMPTDGWPVILYAHGTGGNYLTFVREQLDLRAGLILRAGQQPVRMAMVGIDQVLHGPRDPTGSNPEITFFNLQNLLAARDNVKQGAVDNFQLVRLVEKTNVAHAPNTGAPIRFDSKRIYFLGHSQGGLTGPLFVAAEPQVKAAVLSGAGSVLILSLLNKTAPVNIAELVGNLLQETPWPDHPLLNLLQAFFESSDPNNYGRLFFTEPLAEMPTKHIFQTLGLWDTFTPVPNIAAFALSMGVQPVEPKLYDLPYFALTGQSWTRGQVAQNVAHGSVTGVLKQYVAPPREDGHFVIFDLWAARHDWTRFLGSHVQTGVATLE